MLCTKLQIFAFRDWEFKLVAEHEIYVPAALNNVEDVNGDGKIEIVTIEMSDTEFPYAAGLRDEVWYHFQNDGFIEIKRTPLYTREELNQGHANEFD